MDTDDSKPTITDNTASVTDAATQAWETTRDKAAEVLESGENYVRENPMTAVLSILGVGFVIGLIVGRGIAHGEK